MAVSSEPRDHIPGTMTAAAYAVIGALIVGALWSVITAAKATDWQMAAHAWTFAIAFVAFMRQEVRA